MAQLCPQKQIATYGMLCNAGSKSTLQYACHLDIEGNVKGKYPPCIENDKCGEFVHVGELLGSVAGVAYRIKCGCMPGAKQYDWVVAWSNHPLGPGCPCPNKAYTTIVEVGTPWDWDSVKNELNNSQGSAAKCESGGYIVNVTITNDTSAKLVATITRG